jgi:hypothetical protein
VTSYLLPEPLRQGTLTFPSSDIPEWLRQEIETMMRSGMFDTSMPMVDITIRRVRLAEMTVNRYFDREPEVKLEVVWGSTEIERST